MSVDLSTLKPGDKLRYVDRPRDELWVDAISDQGAEMGGAYIRSGRGFFGVLTNRTKHLYEKVPAVDIDPTWVYAVNPATGSLYRADPGPGWPRIRIIAYEVVT